MYLENGGDLILRVNLISAQVKQLIIASTQNCRDKMSERVYWILNDIEDYPICEECGKQFQPRFYGFKSGYGGNRFCSPKCIANNDSVKQKTENTIASIGHFYKKRFEKNKQKLIETYGVENVFQLESVKKQIKETNLERYGVEYASQSEQVKNKMQDTCEERYGHKFTLQVAEFRKKGKQTCIKKYGVECILSSKEFREKFKSINLIKYGYEFTSQVPKIKEKIKQTCIKKYGTTCTLQSSKIKEKTKQTNLERYGVENVFQLESVKEQIKETNLERYGVEYPLQNPEILEKNQKSKFHSMVSPSGNEIKYQGYENIALKELFSLFKEDDIITSRSKMPKFWYVENEKKRRYFPDIWIPSKNLIIEVKSEWTFIQHFEGLILKSESCLTRRLQF